LACCRSESIAATNSDTFMSRPLAISLSALQNASSRLTLVGVQGWGYFLMRCLHQAGLRFVCGDQSGRTSAPRWPHREQTMRVPSSRIGVSSGMWSAFMTAL